MIPEIFQEPGVKSLESNTEIIIMGRVRHYCRQIRSEGSTAK